MDYRILRELGEVLRVYIALDKALGYAHVEEHFSMGVFFDRYSVNTVITKEHIYAR